MNSYVFDNSSILRETQESLDFKPFTASYASLRDSSTTVSTWHEEIR